jgi:hypothetical protein
MNLYHTNSPHQLENFSYTFIPQQTDCSIQTTSTLSCQITVLWGSNIIHQTTLSNQSFYVGETLDCNYLIPQEILQTNKLPIVIYQNNNYYAYPNNKLLSPQESHQIQISNFTFKVNVDHQFQPVNNKKLFDKLSAIFHTGSLVLHSVLLGSVAMLMPDFETSNQDISVENQLIMSQYLAATTEKEKIQQISEPINLSSSNKITGSSKNDSGAMGNINSSLKNSYSVAGPKNTEIYLSKQNILQQASDFGLISILSANSMDVNTPSNTWNTTNESGNSLFNYNGSLSANEVGEGFGIGGLSLTGLGEGGNNSGDGVGVGKINALGNNLYNIYGPSSKLTSTHKPKPIQMRIGNTSSSGKIPPDVIQRIIRQNFGTFKLCYQNALRNNPSLTGKVAVQFVIDHHGAVSQTSNNGSDLPDAAATSCVINSFKGLSFPAPEQGIVTVTYSIQFSPQ